MRVKILHVAEVASLAISPVVSHAMVGSVRVVVLLAVGVRYLLEVLWHEVVAWMLSTPLPRSTLLLLESVLLRGRKLNVVLFQSPLIRPQSRVRPGQLRLHSLGQVVEAHREVREVVLPVVLLRHRVRLPERRISFLILQSVGECLRPFALNCCHLLLILDDFASAFVFACIAPTCSFELDGAFDSISTVFDGHSADMLDVHVTEYQIVHRCSRSAYQIVLVTLLEHDVLVADRDSLEGARP